jgi:putative oxidoreductase
MTRDAPTTPSPFDWVRGLIEFAVSWMERIPSSLVALLARFSVAATFWRSGQTKVDGWEIMDSTFFLFEEEYQVPLLPPELAAYMATIAEHLFPVLLVVGLASRFSALALFGMTMVIQVFVYPEAWAVHLFWFAAMAYIMARGPGVLSVDHLIYRKFNGAPSRRSPVIVAGETAA